MSYVLIVDQFRRYEEAHQHKRPVNATDEAMQLSMMTKLLGGRNIAIVSDQDEEGLSAYGRAGFELFSMNGDRRAKVSEFIGKMNRSIQVAPPKRLILVTDDVEFRYLLDPATENQQTQVELYVPGTSIPPELRNPRYSPQPLEMLLPEAKIPRLDVRLDYENLHIGLQKRGWQTNARTLIEAVKEALASYGEVVRIAAYADWGLLYRNDGKDWQRDLAAAGVETHYLVNEHGKNTADMKIADAVRDLVERNASTPDAADIIVIGTNDRDFRAVVETAKQRRQRVVLLAIKDGLSRHLLDLVEAKNIRYIDDYLQLKRKTAPKATAALSDGPRASDRYAHLLARLVAWMSQKGPRGWYFAPERAIFEEALTAPEDREQVAEAVDAGHLLRQRRNGTTILMLNRQDILAQAVELLVYWSRRRVDYCLNVREMPYIDSKFLANGMQLDKQLKEVGVGQKRYEAEEWLDLLAEAGVIIPKRQPHPRAPEKTITTWWLPERQEKDEAVSAAEVVGSAEATSPSSASVKEKMEKPARPIPPTLARWSSAAV